MPTAWLGSVVLLTIAASALPAQRADTVAPPPAPRPPKSSSTQITAEDIEKVRASVASAFDAVQLLRPRWLKKSYDTMRDPGVPPGNLYMRAAEIWVFMDDHEMGGLNYLKALPAEQVFTLKFLRVNEVSARYGLENAPGIVVTLKQP